MARARRRGPSPARDVVGFWVAVVIVALLLGGGAFAAARYWIGGMISGKGIDSGGPDVTIQTPAEPQGPGSTAEIAPPREAEVTVTQRAPTEGEKVELETGFPQDGAGLNASTGTASPPDDSVDGDSATPVAPGKKGAYTVVAGSFAAQANAERLVARLMAAGYTPYTTQVQRDGRTFHRVCVGAYDQQKDALALRDRLTANGLPASITRD